MAHIFHNIKIKAVKRLISLIALTAQ